MDSDIRNQRICLRKLKELLDNKAPLTTAEKMKYLDLKRELVTRHLRIQKKIANCRQILGRQQIELNLLAQSKHDAK